MSALLTFYLNETAGQIAILHGRDSTHHLYTLYLIGRDTTHIDTGIGKVAGSGLCIPCPTEVLHIGICRDGCTVHDESCSQGRRGIVAAARCCLTQVDGIGGCQGRSTGTSARQQFQQVGKTGRLQMLHGMFLNLRSCGKSATSPTFLISVCNI